MASIIDGVDQRTQLAGHNRLELLLFELQNGQTFGINVFKVREAIPCPSLTQIPHAHPAIRGVARIRGQAISIFDLSMAIGNKPVYDLESNFVIITEYNRTVQGFLVANINRIINTSWAEILPAPAGIGQNSFLTAITKIDGELVEIIDVEKVLAEVVGINHQVSEDLSQNFSAQNQHRRPHILVADDSSVARKQIAKTMEQIGIDTTIVIDGKQALEQLQHWQDEGIDVKQHIALVISDIEMPEMDGYSLTTAIRKDPALDTIQVLLHSSMSGGFNESLVEKVGANKFIAKFDPNELATAVQEMVDIWRQ
ncbi:MAG: chemotaxis protein CheV [Piscirickettsiaceae bacterium]|nr:chemotaxis protein CheV [Piscirickettsiaceae bacterium]